MKEVTLDQKKVYGLSLRTNMVNEMNPSTAKIGDLWQKFDAEVAVDYKGGERVYGLYYDYENGIEGDFSVTAAYDGQAKGLEKLLIEAGKYLLFEAEAKSANDLERTNTVIALWGEVWDYFANEPQHTRAFNRDFDFYKDQTHIEVYVSIL